MKVENDDGSKNYNYTEFFNTRRDKSSVISRKVSHLDNLMLDEDSLNSTQ